MADSILRHPEQNPMLERMLQIQRAADDPERELRHVLTADERHEVEDMIRTLTARIEEDIHQLSGLLFLYGQSKSKLVLTVHMGDLGKGRTAAGDIRAILTPNGDAFAND